MLNSSIVLYRCKVNSVGTFCVTDSQLQLVAHLSLCRWGYRGGSPTAVQA